MILLIIIFFDYFHFSSQQYYKKDFSSRSSYITAEPLRACTSQLEPFQLDTMLFFPSDLKICASIESNKGINALSRDRARTTHLRPLVFLSIRPGYQGDYRFAPDLGYYQTCQRSISQHLDKLVEKEKDILVDSKSPTSIPLLNSTTNNCPIHSLPGTIRELNACKLKDGQWYELSFRSAIQYEILITEKNIYQQMWVNHSTTFVFKPDREVWRNGTELYWLQRLLQLRVKMKNCEAVRYLLKLDESWSSGQLPVTVFIDYQVRENAYVKHSRHLGNGTLMDGWFTGTFPVWRTPELRTHELCVQFAWPRSLNQYRLCRTFLRGRSSLDCDPFSYYTQYSVASKSENNKNKLIINFVIYIIFILFFN
ncbi:unnamed protein product [Meloidogyne enterolobii]|uniref:Uncharacterized protein n=1 Tax=Meloidogyne enterolobii TaxID=390850 RepID=A0ACB0ZI48_MELEN